MTERPAEMWLPFLDNRTICLAPPPEFRRVLEEIRELGAGHRITTHAVVSYLTLASSKKLSCKIFGDPAFPYFSG
jgi:hypothetical protein